MNDLECKPLALLIPGLDGTGELFYRQEELLAPKYRTLAWNYGPGANFGLSDLTMKLGQATECEHPGSLLVAAESFGGLVGIDFALRYPERVRRLILVNTFPYYRRRVRLNIAWRIAPLLKAPVARHLKNAVVDIILSGEGIMPEDRRRFREIVEHIDPEGYRRRLQLIVQTNLTTRLREIKVPTVLLASRSDKVVPSVSEARMMKTQIPNATLHEFPGAGHLLLLTRGISLLDYA